MEDFKQCNLEFEDNNLNELVKKLNDIYKNKQNNFVDICSTIHRMWKNYKNNYCKTRNNEYYNVYSLLEKFGFDKNAVSRYVRSYEKYIESIGADTKIRDVFFPFSSSKLFEMLKVEDETLLSAIEKKIITSEMTLKQIRLAVKRLSGLAIEKASEVENEDIEELEAEVPEAFDYKKEYEKEYFYKQSKEYLVTIAYSLYCELKKYKK